MLSNGFVPAWDQTAEIMRNLGLVQEVAQDGGNALPSDSSKLASDASFIPPLWYPTLELWAKTERGASLMGPRGAGKTRAIHNLATQCGVDLISFQAARGCTVDDLLGVRDLKDGSTTFTPGPLAEAVERDCWLVLEEANALHPAVALKMNTLLDGSGDKLRLVDGRKLPVGPNFRAFFCYNPDYNGAQEVNQAVIDRLPPIFCSYMPECTETGILRARTGCDEATAVGVVSFATKVRAARASLNFDLSIRALTRLVNGVRAGMTWDEALTAAILDLVGDPYSKRPQREAIGQIAKLDGMSGWAAPVFDGLSSDESSTEGGEA